MNNLANKTCQLVDRLPPTGPNYPPPCMFTVRLRLAGLLSATQPQQAIELYQEVLTIDPLRLGVNAAIGGVYVDDGRKSAPTDPSPGSLPKAIAAYQAEIALSPGDALADSS